MGANRRAFAMIADSTVGGTPYDQLAAGAIPDATALSTITEATIEDNEKQLTRDDDINGVRGMVEPEEFQEAPVVNLKGRLTPSLLKQFIGLMSGSTPSQTGVAPAAITRKWEPVGYGVQALPAVHLTVLGDDLYEKVAGCQLTRAEFTFPLDDHATFDVTFAGLFRKQESAAPPAFTYPAQESVFKLRDAQAFVDGAPQAIDGMRSYSLTYDNKHEDPEFWPKRNRVITPVTGERDRILWYPQQRILGSSLMIGGKIGFFDVKTAEEQSRHLARARQVVFEIEGEKLATTPAVRRMFRVTGKRSVYTGGGASSLQKEGRRNSEYDLGLFADPITGIPASFEIVEPT